MKAETEKGAAVPEWLEREQLLLGEEALARLMSSTVAVVGCGGVGGFAAEMLVRGGVGHIILFDNDVVSETNRNRQILALDSTMGRPKCSVLAERLRDINPALDVECRCEYLEADRVEEQLAGWSGRVDFVVDAIDTLAPKLALIRFCVEHKLPLVSSMGAGAKVDVTQVRIADLSKSRHCPLAFIVRKRLGKIGIRKGFPVVYSEELPDRESIVPVEERNKKSQVGTISYLPAVFGCACAQAALLYLKNN
ncbi:MAG: tRNA threonylcarbamoyladenosine dehydratase [Bacteroidales bacterium]|nr:tRNA threonylcarbamoyladenosine dehydratase [Bacteroidales bacterium]